MALLGAQVELHLAFLPTLQVRLKHRPLTLTHMTVSTDLLYYAAIILNNFFLVCFLLGDSPASEFQTPGNHPEENIQHTEQGESLKSKIFFSYSI
jgi:hypothetical protein